MYALVWTPGIGMTGLGLLWVILALVLDIGGYGSAGYANRDRIIRCRVRCHGRAPGRRV